MLAHIWIHLYSCLLSIHKNQHNSPWILIAQHQHTWYQKKALSRQRRRHIPEGICNLNHLRSWYSHNQTNAESRERDIATATWGSYAMRLSTIPWQRTLLLSYWAQCFLLSVPFVGPGWHWTDRTGSRYHVGIGYRPAELCKELTMRKE